MEPDLTRRRVNPGWRFARGTGRGRARGFLRFWPLWEAFTLWLWHVQPIPGAPHDLVHIRLMRYRGRPMALPDGVTIARGAYVAEIHLHNPVLTQIADHTATFDLLRLVQDDLHALARWVASDPDLAGVQAIFGVSLLSRATPRLGFTLRDRPITLHARLERFFLRGLLALYSPDGLARLAQGNGRASFPQEIWLSRKELLQRYGK